MKNDRKYYTNLILNGSLCKYYKFLFYCSMFEFRFIPAERLTKKKKEKEMRVQGEIVVEMKWFYNRVLCGVTEKDVIELSLSGLPRKKKSNSNQFINFFRFIWISRCYSSDANEKDELAFLIIRIIICHFAASRTQRQQMMTSTPLVI